MGTLRFLIWSSLCIGLGIFLGSYEVHGHTPWQMMQGTWKQQSPKLDKVRDDAAVLVDDFKKKPAPSEQHSADDKKAIDAIIGKRTKS